jgi:hypothetical protein
MPFLPVIPTYALCVVTRAAVPSRSSCPQWSRSNVPPRATRLNRRRASGSGTGGWSEPPFPVTAAGWPAGMTCGSWTHSCEAGDDCEPDCEPGGSRVTSGAWEPVGVSEVQSCYYPTCHVMCSFPWIQLFLIISPAHCLAMLPVMSPPCSELLHAVTGMT